MGAVRLMTEEGGGSKEHLLSFREKNVKGSVFISQQAPGGKLQDLTNCLVIFFVEHVHISFARKW